MIILNGFFQSEIYVSTDKSFRILKVDALYNGQDFPSALKNTENNACISISVKGKIPKPAYTGQKIEIGGEWVYNPKMKKYAFEAKYLIQTLPITKEDSISFLKGIGAKEDLAKAIMEKYASLENAFENWESLYIEIKGFKKSKAQKLKSIISQIAMTEKITRKLNGKVSSEVVAKICRKQVGLPDLEKNPYTLCKEKVLTFDEADSVADAFGWKKNHPIRITYGILSAANVIKNRTSSIVLNKSVLSKNASTLLKISEEEVSAGISYLQSKEILVSSENYLYLKRDFLTEKMLSERIAEILHISVNTKDSALYEKSFNELKDFTGTLAEAQKQAVLAVGKNVLSVVTGNPGTGKTTTLKAIMETYKKTFPESSITLMAPTGLAAKRMASACKFSASTIHKTLQLMGSPEDEDLNGKSSVIDGGLIIVDEFSMVGLHLAQILLTSINVSADTRIVFVGDIDQLPSVSPGAVLDALIASGSVPVTRLTKNYRQEAGSPIINGAYAINEGDCDKLKFDGDFRLVNIENPQIEVETHQILNEIVNQFQNSVREYGLENTFVLCPMRKKKFDSNRKITISTLLSTDSLNPILRDIVNPPSADLVTYGKFREKDRVINLKNKDDLMNGDIGVITKICKVDDVQTIFVKFDGIEKEKEYSPEMLGNLDLAYCITVHKSQGSEYSSVIFPASMTQAVMLQRNLLYTAVTRAKKYFVAVGNLQAIHTAVKTVKSKTKRDLLATRIACLMQ